MHVSQAKSEILPIPGFAPHLHAFDSGAAQSRLLIIDDDPRLLHSLHELLRDDDIQVTTSRTGKEALEQLASARFDLVLLDLCLPDVGGHRIMDVIRREKIDVDVVVISGRVEIEAAIGALKRGAYDYVRKPYSFEEILATVRNALEGRRLRQANRYIALELENSERMYRYLVDASPDIIYTLDDEGRFTYINDRVGRLLGFQREQLIGQPYQVLVFEDDLELANHAFNERRGDERAARNIELRLKCSPRAAVQDPEQEAAVRTISLNASGMYLQDRASDKPGFVGTYGVVRDITERKRAEAVISYQAYHDILTDLPNRSLFQDRLGLALIQAKRKKTDLAVMFIDLDRFKLVNDTLGHFKGDQLLQQVARRLKACLREGDTLARQGGDEFTVVLPDLHQHDDAGLVAAKIIDSLQQPFQLDEHTAHISASIGIAVYPAHGESLDELLRNADTAMYQVKGEGKNGFAFFDQSSQELLERRIAFGHSLRRALANDELEMYYQPQVDSTDNRIVGVEALIRWNHPTRGLILPAEFLPYAEENDLVAPMSDWMIDALCRDVHAWKGVCGDLKLSINIAPQTLDRGSFYDKMRGAIADYGIAPGQIEIEVTENICIDNPHHAIDQLRRLEQLGVSVAIDDFGIGYSSLAYLHRFPVNTIKIDQSFIRTIVDEEAHYPVVLAIIAIARGLRLNLIAEGVETDVQVRYLRAHGCTVMQGYRFHRPMPVGEFVALVTAG
ncbi:MULTISPECIES: EAL domain-containing protein [unclassified Massilia]|uniref:EAL domain-containing response regulator n=1 Tax=unclassified Massilia TaxID=2609279 RepID=UPI001780A613|nr:MULTISPECIES: EAL domain-containing protein [unclassified Massilia]MBD8532822.1 EAL domain-containing protein [Massilia sp. CFBP 13647]MBD8676183.1 EAL domain-containing protein [Massilia sp. CFBP 13721]